MYIKNNAKHTINKYMMCWNIPGPGIANPSIRAGLAGIFGLVIKGVLVWYDDIKTREILRQKNHDMELALVKSQLDPSCSYRTTIRLIQILSSDLDQIHPNPVKTGSDSSSVRSRSEPSRTHQSDYDQTRTKHVRSRPDSSIPIRSQSDAPKFR